MMIILKLIWFLPLGLLGFLMLWIVTYSMFHNAALGAMLAAGIAAIVIAYQVHKAQRAAEVKEEFRRRAQAEHEQRMARIRGHRVRIEGFVDSDDNIVDLDRP